MKTKYVIAFCHPFLKIDLNYDQTSDTSSDNEWQQVTTSCIMSDNEWYNE